MNKNQKIALIAGAIILAIIVITIPVMTNSNNTLNYYYPFQFKSALIWGGVVAVFTSLAFILLKEKD